MEKWLKYFPNLILIILLGCTNNSSIESTNRKRQADIAFKKAESYYQGSLKNMSALKKVLKIDSLHSYTLRELSVPYLKRGMPLEWQPLYQKAVEADPIIWVPMRGYLYLIFYRDYEKAIADFSTSDTLTPYLDYPQGHSVDFWRGIAYLGLKDYKNSIFYWNKHISKETEDSGEDWVELEAFLYRGIAYYELGNYEKALADFDKILAYFKTSAETKYYYAKILFQKGELENAITYCNKAETDLKNKLGLHHDYVEMLRQVYLSDIEELKSEIMR